MKKQELANKSGTEKKNQVFQGRLTQRGPESSDYKTEDYFQQISAESSPERLLSILTSPELPHPINALQKLNIINELQKNYGNSNIQRMIQAKLKIGQPNDKYEQEADRVAERVMQIPEPQTHWQSEEEKEKEEEEILQTKTVPGQAPEVTRDLESRIHALRGAGQPLQESVRAFFEQRFGRDFTQVRIHADARAAELSRSLNAKALTMGKDILFGPGQYSPETPTGRKLLAHELTHVVQQTGIQKKSLLENHIQRMQVQLIPAIGESDRSVILEIQWSTAGYRDFQDRVEKEVQKSLKVPSDWLPQLMHESNLGDVYVVLNEEKPLRPEGEMIEIEASFRAEEAMGESWLYFQVAAVPVTGKAGEAVAEKEKKISAKKPQQVYMFTFGGKEYYLMENEFKAQQEKIHQTIRYACSTLKKYVDIESESHMRFAEEVHGWIGWVADRFGGKELPPMDIWWSAQNALIEAHLALIWFSVADKPDKAAEWLAKYAKNIEKAERLYNQAHKEWCEYRYATIEGAGFAVTLLDGVKTFSFATVAVLGTIYLLPAGVAILGKGLAGRAVLSAAVNTGVKLIEELSTRLSQAAYGEKFNFGEMLNNLGVEALASFAGELSTGVLKRGFLKLVFNSHITADVFEGVGHKYGLEVFLTTKKRIVAGLFSTAVGKGLVKTAIQEVLKEWKTGESITFEEFMERLVKKLSEGMYKETLKNYVKEGKFFVL